jgi:hypothetical protein
MTLCDNHYLTHCTQQSSAENLAYKPGGIYDENHSEPCYGSGLGKLVRLKCCECYEACCGREESVCHLVRNTVFFGPQGSFLFLENTI